MSQSIQNGQRLPALDALRGLAILMVLVAHYVSVPLFDVFRPGSTASYLHATLRLAGSGVDLFFVLSGFLIGGILLDNRESQNLFKTFYCRRFFRIIPVYALLVLAYLIVVKLASFDIASLRIPVGEPFPLAVLATFTQNMWMINHHDSPFVGVTWSLAVEEQFYLTLPALIRFVPRKAITPVVVSLAVLAVAARLIAYQQGSLSAAFYLLPCRFDSLLLGVCGALLVRSSWWGRDVTQKVIWAMFFVGAGAMIFFTLSDKDPFLVGVVKYSFVAVFYVSLLLLVLSNSTVSRIISRPSLRRVGDWAYALYLIHMPVASLCFAILLGGPLKIRGAISIGVMLLALAITFGLSILSWHALEKPMIARGKRFKYGEKTIHVSGLVPAIE
jgi:peptidoglycan/LPS O-acetylase OafA/YrhL